MIEVGRLYRVKKNWLDVISIGDILVCLSDTRLRILKGKRIGRNVSCSNEEAQREYFEEIID